MSAVADEAKAARVRAMFARIVPRYDTINTMMTLGLDRRWRQRTVALVEPKDGLGLDMAVSFVGGDAMRLPFSDATFDCIVNGFMLRNVADLDGTLVELCRVLKPGGRLACLDLTPPRGS